MPCPESHSKFQTGVFNGNIDFQRFLFLTDHWAALPTKCVLEDLFTMEIFCYKPKSCQFMF